MRILTANAKVLLAVLENPHMTQKQIAEMVGMRYQHVWRALDRLVKSGILNKQRKSRRTIFTPGENFYQLDDIMRIKACIQRLDEIE